MDEVGLLLRLAAPDATGSDAPDATGSDAPEGPDAPDPAPTELVLRGTPHPRTVIRA